MLQHIEAVCQKADGGDLAAERRAESNLSKTDKIYNNEMKEEGRENQDRPETNIVLGQAQSHYRAISIDKTEKM